jgi:uncharacterized protein YdhG (YjbR/CyaY superfamily)
MKKLAEDIDSYVSLAPKEVQPLLKQLRATIKQVAPTASESISYRMPHFKYNGQLVWFALMKNHIGLYLRPPIVEMHKKELAKYTTTKSAIHFPLDQKLPIPLIKKLLRARMKMNEAESNQHRGS